jgi:hypothetical protein
MSAIRIRIRWRSGEVSAELEGTASAQALMAALPFESTASTWGEEVYFSTPISPRLEANAQQVVDPGTVCFWVEGRSLALPYGPTPISKGKECRLVAKVNVLGKIVGDARALASVRDGDHIKVERAS